MKRTPGVPTILPLSIVRLTLLTLYRESYSVGIAAALLAAALCLVTAAITWVWLRPETTPVQPSVAQGTELGAN